MDAIDILGSILGGADSKGGGGFGGQILRDMMQGKRRGQPQPKQQAPKPTSRQSDRGYRGSGSIEQQARELEDLFGVARQRNSSQRNEPVPVPQPQRRHTHPPRFDEVGTRYRQPHSERPKARPQPQPCETQDEVIVLIRAMVNATKADGRVTQKEQEAILSRIANPSRETIQFLNDEFAKPLDVREFAWNVPLGMEEKVYMLSLSAIDLDAQAEACYLHDLAHGLRLSPEECNEIHRQLGAPLIG